MPKFEKGQSGNPAGRKRGTGHAAKLRKAIEDDLPAIIDALVGAAKSGDTSASKLLIDRVLPTLKPVQQNVTVRGLTGRNLSDQGTVIVAAMGRGSMTPDQAQAMLASLASLARIIETDELEKRISALEEGHSDEESKNQST